MTTAAQVTLYTDNNMPPVPDQIGNIVQIRKTEQPRGQWVCEYQNSVGGTVGYRFATKRAARAYANKLTNGAF